ncbi:hypothetical protein N7G274_008490 [Stereocaulon virgatum]|uniref:F-box domain-containing protein n=1 Tax=Stereocaulon virgatum TaxID=373712 RepID=A0ABR4A2X4_9LECA
MPRSSSRPNKAKSKPQAAATPRRSRLLDLALELREAVYRQIACDEPSSLVDLLTVNHQLAREVKPFLYRQALTFDGQTELFDWLDEVDHTYLQHVYDVRFKLHDIDPARIVGALGRRLQQANISRQSGSWGPDTEDNPYFKACHIDLKRISTAFRLLPNVRHFTILPNTGGDPKPHHRTMDAFSNLLGHCFPNLQSLTSEEDQFPVDFLLNKSKLRRLRLPATTTSDDSETAKMFRNLPLRELEICRLPHHTASAAEDDGCVTPILYGLSPLQSLTIFEDAGSETPSLAAEVFVGSDVGTHPVVRKHRHSLRTLKLFAEPGPEFSPTIFATTFLDSSSLTCIEYLDSWSAVYEHLPSTIQSVVWRINWYPSTSIDALIDRIKYLVTRAIRIHTGPIGQRLSNLKSIEVSLSPVDLEREPDDDGPKPEDILMAAQKRLRTLGVDFSWKVQNWHEIL